MLGAGRRAARIRQAQAEGLQNAKLDPLTRGKVGRFPEDSGALDPEAGFLHVSGSIVWLIG